MLINLGLRQLLGSCLSLFLSLLLLLCLNPCFAHEPFEITTTAKILPEQIRLNLLITDSTASKICFGEDPIVELSSESLQARNAEWRACAKQLFALADDGIALAPLDLTMGLGPENDWDVTLVYPPSRSGKLRFSALHLAKLDDSSYGDTFTATTADSFLVQRLLQAENPDIDLSVEQAPERAGFTDYLQLGIEHILGGYDHLLFLAGLLLVCRNLRACLWIITAFTLAHSLTLALAALGLIQIPARWAELGIAATIVFVGLENLWLWRKQQAPRWRWQLCFGFGLIHGVGFAGALREAGVSQAGWDIVPPLLGFNLGVEAGQIALALIFLPLLFWLKKWPKLKWLEPLASLGVVIMGCYWLFLRLG
jgi:hydrogenase/urease accessory protein HupE